MTLELLKEDYKRRLQTVVQEIKNTPFKDQVKYQRLAEKGSCYSTFLYELDKLEKSA